MGQPGKCSLVLIIENIIIGEGYAYDVTVQNNTRLFMFYNGCLACLVFKS